MIESIKHQSILVGIDDNSICSNYFHGLDTAELIDCTEEEAMELIAQQENSNKN